MAATFDTPDETDVVDATRKRDIAAAEEPMIVCRLGSGLYEVFSGEHSRYVVDMLNSLQPRCTCDDHRFRVPRGEILRCKHVSRVRQTLRHMDIPEEAERVDVTLRKQRERRL